MNLSFPHFNIPLHTFAASIAIGLAPWNYLTCKAGQVISQFSSKDEIMNTSTYFMLMGLALVFLLPPIGRKIYSKFQQKSIKTKAN